MYMERGIVQMAHKNRIRGEGCLDIDHPSFIVAVSIICYNVTTINLSLKHRCDSNFSSSCQSLAFRLLVPESLSLAS